MKTIQVRLPDIVHRRVKCFSREAAGRPHLGLVAIGVGVLFGVESAPAADPPQTPSGHDSVLVESRPEGRALRAMVVHDPDDRRGTHGYFHVAEVYSARMLEPNIRRLMEDGSGSLLQNPTLCRTWSAPSTSTPTSTQRCRRGIRSAPGS